MSDDRIYVRFKGKTLGPLTDQKVRDLVRRGQITRMHDLSSDGLSWQKAEEFSDFFRASTGTVTRTPASTSVAADTDASIRLGVSPASPSSNHASKPIPGQMPDDGVQWYAHVQGANQGPINSPTLEEWIRGGDVQRDTLVWRAGYDEWQPAGNCLPEKFAEQFDSQPGFKPEGTAGFSPLAGAVGRAGVSSEVISRTTSQRPWVMILSVLGLAWAGLAVIYFVTTMIVGADAKWVPLGGSRSVIYGLSGLIGCGIQIAGSILLLNYGSSLKVLDQRRDMANMQIAAKRLGAFWKFCTIVVIVWSVLVIGTAVLLLVMAAAATDAVT